MKSKTSVGKWIQGEYWCLLAIGNARQDGVGCLPEPSAPVPDVCENILVPAAIAGEKGEVEPLCWCSVVQRELWADRRPDRAANGTRTNPERFEYQGKCALALDNVAAVDSEGLHASHE